MMKLEELVGRLALTDSPSRELDAEIAACVRVTPENMLWVSNWKGEMRAIQGLVHLIGNSGSCGSFHPLAYTRSVDAAMTLIPRTPPNTTPTGIWDWQFEQTNGGLTISARVGPQKEPSFADTPAIALCIAALRARVEDQ